MKKHAYNQIPLFGPLYAYLVVLSPPEKIRNDVARIKRQLHGIADIQAHNLRSVAHITLVERRSDDISLPDTVSGLVTGITPFVVKVDGWSFFDHGHSVTVYLTIANPGPIIHLMRSLKSKARSPHISLAKRVPREALAKWKPFLDELNYTEEWTCSEVTVLRKLMSAKHLGFKDSTKIPLQEEQG